GGRNGERADQGPLARAGRLQLLRDLRPPAVRGAACHPAERRAPGSRPRLPAAANRTEPGRRAEHQVARLDRGLTVKAWRIGLSVLGMLAMAFGLVELITGVPASSLARIAVWLAAAVVIHDALWSPALLGAGPALGR